jgi:hypothetical protein
MHHEHHTHSYGQPISSCCTQYNLFQERRIILNTTPRCPNWCQNWCQSRLLSGPHSCLGRRPLWRNEAFLPRSRGSPHRSENFHVGRAAYHDGSTPRASPTSPGWSCPPSPCPLSTGVTSALTTAAGGVSGRPVWPGPPSARVAPPSGGMAAGSNRTGSDLWHNGAQTPARPLR